MFHRLFSAMTNGGGRRGLLYLLTLVAATGGVIAIALAIQWQQSAPQPSAAAAGRISSYGPTQPPPSKPQANDSPSEPSPVEPPPTSTAGPVPVARSVPKVLEIPAIGVRSSVIPVGRTPAGTLAVPQPGPDLDKAAWYKNSPTPGQPGPSVIEGHIDSQQGPSVFFELGAMRPGDLIKVTRADGSLAVFTVNAVRSYPSHKQFPTNVVYGGDLSHPTLRLITCSNFDSSTGHYVGNTVVFAHLTTVRPPTRSP